MTLYTVHVKFYDRKFLYLNICIKITIHRVSQLFLKKSIILVLIVDTLRFGINSLTCLDQWQAKDKCSTSSIKKRFLVTANGENNIITYLFKIAEQKCFSFPRNTLF